MKDWQHGIDIERLKAIEDLYAPYNAHALSVFGRFKKNNIAERLHAGTLVVDADLQIPGSRDAAWVVEKVKARNQISMHGRGPIIGEKVRGDVTISRLVGNERRLGRMLDEHHRSDCWLYTFAAARSTCALAKQHGFRKVGYKVSSASEIMAVYFRNRRASPPREHPPINPAELVNMAKLCDVSASLKYEIACKLTARGLPFTNHYSKYNASDAWSALALRGYSADFAFISKPTAMSAAWQKAHAGDAFGLQDTPLFGEFPEVRKLLSFLDGPLHRVRFMRLAPGGGELERHTDQVDEEMGNVVGSIARLHFPITTNPGVIFSTWDADDRERTAHFSVGGCWLLDTRKPHRAINGGDRERIHLVVDVEVTRSLEGLIRAAGARSGLALHDAR